MSMNFFDVCAARYSHRSKFTGAPVPKADLEKIVLAGTQAPSGCNGQTTYFTVVTSPELLAELTTILDSDAIRTAQAIFVVSTEKRTYNFGGDYNLDFEIEDYASAIQNMLLATTALGYATCWYDGGTRIWGADEKIAKICNIPANRQVRTLLPIGVPETVGKQAGRKPIEERVNWL